MLHGPRFSYKAKALRSGVMIRLFVPANGGSTWEALGESLELLAAIESKFL